MSAENLPVAPELLTAGFADRVWDYLTTVNMDRIDRNILKADLVRHLGEVVTENLTNRNLDTLAENTLSAGIITDAKGAPWSALMAISDSITGAESERAPKPGPKSPFVTNTLVRFDSSRGREQFYHFAESAFAGIPNPYQPRIRRRLDSPRELLIHNFAYADISTIGRISTALMRKQFKHLGRSLNGVAQSSIEAITTSSLRPHLPPELAERADRLEQTLGSACLLSSGHNGRVGRSMREVLVPTKAELEEARENGKTKEDLSAEFLAIQRRPGQVPDVEAKTRFISDRGQVPISRNTLKSTIHEQLAERGRELAKPYKERDWDKAVRDAWGLASGAGVIESGGALIRALSTIIAACTVSATSLAKDKRFLAQSKKPSGN